MKKNDPFKIFVGKTITRVDSQAINSKTFYFSDGTSTCLETEPFALGLSGIVVGESSVYVSKIKEQPTEKYIDVSGYSIQRIDREWVNSDFFDDDGCAYADAKVELSKTRAALAEARATARHYFQMVSNPDYEFDLIADQEHCHGWLEEED